MPEPAAVAETLDLESLVADVVALAMKAGASDAEATNSVSTFAWARWKR
jgi:hypothetical protein